jgi:hypothetical protein
MKYWFVTLIVGLLVVIAGVYLLIHRGPTSMKQTTAHGCVSQQFNVGDSGGCVADIQTLIDFIETDGLTMCPFSGSQQLAINGDFDAATQEQVKIVQAWGNCYNSQEGVSTRISTNGLVDSPTWSELCTYGYQYPKQSNSGVSPFLQRSIQAGANAGC